MSWHIASVSFGKDSLAMLIGLIERRLPLDEVLFYDTGMEFDAIYRMRDQILPLLRREGILYTELRPRREFLYMMLEKPVNGKNGIHYGYSWCGGPCRWGTSEKTKASDIYAEARGATVYVGIAADERRRLVKGHKKYKRFPLAEWGVDEAQALACCYQHGFYWQEDGIRLYDILSRVSCWCCANKNLTELENIYHYLPRYWQGLRYLQERTHRPMKGPGKSVFELERRFMEKSIKAA